MEVPLRTAFQRRAPLDGMRGIFVLIVVLFHFNFERFSLGYVGVDGFFVLSGFVITATISTEVLHFRTFSFAFFYARRSKRLLPASFVVLACTSATYFFFSSVDNLRSLRLAFLAAASYWENWHLISISQDRSEERRVGKEC